MSRQFYFEHDNRGPSTSKFRQVNLMGRQRKNRDNFYSRNFQGGKTRLDGDGDVEMGGSHAPGAERRFNPYSFGHNSNRKKHRKPGNKSKHDRGTSDSDAFTWYKITIPHGKKIGKSFILKAISSECKDPFIPYNFHFAANTAEFFVNDHSIARQIKTVNRRVTTPDGFKMVVIMDRAVTPFCAIDAETAEHLKTSMSSRYDVLTHSLNLSKFHSSEGLKSLCLYLPLNKPVVISAVTKIIKENIPEIEALNLSDNKLLLLEPLGSLVSVCKQLKSLILQNNRIRSVAELNHLKGLDLLDLVLDGNPLCDDFKDKTSYISAVRDRFPKLLRLDGHELPAPIIFDLGPETFPVSKKSFFAADDVKDMVIQFLDLYYTIYDSGDRSNLIDAYHNEANFSLCLSKNYQKSSGSSSSALDAYNTENRNLLREKSHSQRFKLLKQGKCSVVAALSELSQTMHDPTSFSVDIFHISPVLMGFSVIGVFKEVGADINNATLKTFSRTFIVAPRQDQGGFVIVNETLFIAHASQEQQAKAFKVPAPTPSPSPAPSPDEKNASEKQLIVLELSKQTGMNLAFSAKCLEENDWDYQRSLAVFLKFQSEGKLPPEAFLPV